MRVYRDYESEVECIQKAIGICSENDGQIGKCKICLIIGDSDKLQLAFKRMRTVEAAFASFVNIK